MADEPRETAGVTTRLVIGYVRRHLGEEAVEQLLRLAGEPRPAATLEDERTWSSYATKIALFEAAAQLTGDPHVARSVGESVLHAQVGGPIRLVLSVLGSPAQVVRSVARACPKFSTVATMSAVDVHRLSGTVTYRLFDGYPPNRHDCDLNIGLLSQVPVIFGRAAATIRHDRCQVEGAGECVYEVSWRPSLRRRRNRDASSELDATREQLEDLHRTAADLVSSDDLDDVLARIATRASSAVRGQRYLLAVRLADEAQPRVHGDGFTTEQAAELGAALLDGGDVGRDSSVLVVEVVSARTRYGRLAAFYDAGQAFLPGEHDRLEAYARLAAAALDSATALSAARSRGVTAEALLKVASQLTTAERVEDVCQVVADAVASVVGCDYGGVMLWDEESEQLVNAGLHGWPDGLREQLITFVVNDGDTPGLGRLVTEPAPRLYDHAHGDQSVRTALEHFGVEAVAIAPIVAGPVLVGVLAGCWAAGQGPATNSRLLSRLSGLAAQAATAVARARLVDQVIHQATHDALTGLPNRVLFEDRIDRALARFRRDNVRFALFFLDLDRFKTINDSLGHEVGDQLLRLAAARLLDCVRETDSVARLGGDEFTLLLGEVDTASDAEAIAAKITTSFASPFRIGMREIFVTPSIGIALAPRDGMSAGELLRNADAAMYAAKAAGRNGWRLHDVSHTDMASDRLALETDLRNAIARDELTLRYQPQIALPTRRVIGVEALVRWQHPERGLLTPDRFLSLAEESGLIVPLDLAVIRMACRQGAEWLASGLAPLRIAVNVSGRTFCDATFLPTVLSALDATGFPAQHLEFEITERQALSDLERATRVAHMLTDLGCSLAIDDVGTGYSSLGWLARLPVRRVKIDRSFVSEVDRPGSEPSLAGALITLGRQLGRSVVAEGIEHEAQMTFLLAHGCDEGQGFLFARPMEPEAIVAHLSRELDLAG